MNDFLKLTQKEGPRAVFGPDDGCVVWSTVSPTGRLNSPRNQGRFSAKQSDAMKPVLSNAFGAANTISLTFAALGADGTYFVKYEDKSKDPAMDLKTSYADLKTYLSTLGANKVDVSVVSSTSRP